MQLCAQNNHKITGLVTDAQNGEPIPFANILVRGTSLGATTDFEGRYTIEFSGGDSLRFSYVSYITKMKAIDSNKVFQQINVQMEFTSAQLSEVVVKAGENPAWRILRGVNENKKTNNQKNISAYQYQSYTRTEIDVDNISDKLKKNIVTGRVARVLDKAQKVAGEDGKMILPVFVSESVSDFYFINSPVKIKEVIQKSKVSGVGVGESSILNQLVGQSFVNFNFYDNYFSILGKDFSSPIGNAWRVNYNYYLLDSLLIGEHFCYEIKFKPKNKQDLAFSGKLWVDKETFALVQIDATVNKDANINYIEKIKIQQEFTNPEKTAWFPSNTRIVVDVSQTSNGAAGLLSKVNIRNSNFVLNQAKPIPFYETPIETAENIQADELYWQKARPVALTNEEKRVYQMIDTVKNLPIIKNWVTTLDLIIGGYKTVGKIDIGPYLYTYAYNRFEGHRFRFGFRTNDKFSKNSIIKGYVAVSTKDPSPVKFNLDVSRILSRKRFSEIGIKGGFEAEQLGVSRDEIDFNNNLATALFAAFTRFGRFNRPYYVTEVGGYLNTEITPGLSQNFSVRNREFYPLFPFGYFSDLKTPNSQTSRYYHISELIYEIRYAPGEYATRTKRSKRIKLRKNKENPIFTMRYIYGNKILGDFEYHKFSASITKSIRMGILGRTTVTIFGGYTPSVLPYPLLYVHQGNQSPIFILNAYNMMNYFEFVSDRYLSLQVYHNFEGLFFNRIPLLKKLNWRTHVQAKMLYGTLSDQNQQVSAGITPAGLLVDKVNFLNPTIPYVEVGYGIDNIFKCLRIDFLHRLTYLNNVTPQPNPHPRAPSYFAIKASIGIKL